MSSTSNPKIFLPGTLVRFKCPAGSLCEVLELHNDAKGNTIYSLRTIPDGRIIESPHAYLRLNVDLGKKGDADADNLRTGSSADDSEELSKEMEDKVD